MYSQLSLSDFFWLCNDGHAQAAPPTLAVSLAPKGAEGQSETILLWDFNDKEKPAPPRAVPPPTHNTTHWKWSNPSISSLKAEIERTQLLPEGDTLNTTNIDNLWHSWKDKVLTCARKHCAVPHSPRHTSHPAKPWLNPELTNAIREKHRLYRAYLRTRTPCNWTAYTTQRNKVTHLLRIAKSTYVSNGTGTSHSTPNLHKLMRGLQSSQRPTLPDMLSQGQTLSTPAEKATALNAFFISQSQQSVTGCHEELPSIHSPTPNTPGLTTLETTAQEVSKLLSNLDPSKSPGCDGIPTRLLKEAASSLAPSLATLFNISFERCTIPQEWRDATVTPIHKKGSKTEPSNYRPISLLSVTSKVQERIVADRISKHIQPHLPNGQSGFRPNDGTTQQLSRLIHQITEKRDAGQTVIACFFDLSKAFDRVWHQGLLAKLAHLGLDGKCLQWLASYLTNRRQRVQVESSKSTWLNIPAGVPQGSVLGPLLFTAYTVDLPTACINANTECSQFADDTAIIAAHENFLAAEEHLQSAVTTAAQWLKDWHLLVNESKTTVIHFHHTNRPPPRPPSITLNDTNLTVASRHRHLGLLIQQNLCWNSHVDYIITKATRKMFLLLRLRNSLNTSALSSIYLTYIRPILEYACTVLSPLPATLNDRLERIQRRAARLCLHLPLFEHRTHSVLLHRLKWPSLSSRRTLSHILLAHSLHHRYAPPHLLAIHLPRIQPIRTLRFPRTFELPTTRTNRLRDSPIYASLDLFNSIPPSIRQINPRRDFKANILPLVISSVCTCSHCSAHL